MPLSKEKIEQIEGNILSIMNRNFMGNYTVMEHEMKKQLIYFIIQELTAEAEKAQCLIDALEKICDIHNSCKVNGKTILLLSRLEAEIFGVATAALQSYTNSLK